jgi:periplasmic protein TonB
MPAQLFKAPDESKRARRYAMLPVSIALHAAAAVTFVIIPLAADGDLPDPAALFKASFVKAQPLPPPPERAPVPAARAVNTTAAPTVAPATIEPERAPEPTGPPDMGVPGGIGLSSSIPEAGFRTTFEPPPPPPPPPPTPTLVKVGGLVREPRRLVNVSPVYPPLARSARVEGTVMLEAIINEAGIVEQLKVVRSVALLDQAAIDAVRQWRYTPTLLNGTPVSVVMTITIRVTLTP